jgi:hypothetical protein
MERRAMKEALGWTITLLLWFIAAAVPSVILVLFGTLPAVVAGVVIPALWLSVFPSTCINGGLGIATLSTMQFLYGVGWLGYGVFQGIAFLWRLAAG